MESLRRAFVSDLPLQAAKLTCCSSAGDLDALRTVVHQIKGTSGMFGLTHLTKLPGKIEDQLVGGDVVDAVKQVRDLINTGQASAAAPPRRPDGSSRSRTCTPTDCLLASSVNSPLAPFSRPECRAATGQDAPPRPDGQSLRSEVFSITAMLARISSKDDAAMMAAPYPKSNQRIGLVHDPSLSMLDPVETALESMAEVRVYDSIPQCPALAEQDGLVVLARSTSVKGIAAAEVTQAAGDVPVLWLVGRIDEESLRSGSVTPALWPVAMSQVAEFVSQLATPAVPRAA